MNLFTLTEKKHFAGTSLLILLAFTSLTFQVRSSNIAITSVSATATDITFNISMQYSWNIVGTAGSPNNWDAAWVFVKYNDCASSIPNWQHLNLSSVSTDHSITGGILQADPVSDGMGVFIRRTSPGSNTTTAITGTVTLKFASSLSTANYQFKVFGIEMVNIPSGDFQVGDGSGFNPFNSITITSSMQSSGISTASTTLGGSGTTTGTLPSTYPMGTNSFYCMKNKITTLELLDFLNTLTYDQQAAHLLAGAPNNAVGASVGNTTPTVTISVSGNASTTPKTPATFSSVTAAYSAVVNWSIKTYLAYLDWAGLRPMTELEFEKNCRGPLTRITGEFAWGNANAPGSGVSATSNRTTAGAGYYGVLSLSQNGDEILIVNTTNQATAGGTAYTGGLGNGSLTTSGSADVAGWPNDTNTGGGAGMKRNYNWPMSARSYYNSIAAINGYTARGVR